SASDLRRRADNRLFNRLAHKNADRFESRAYARFSGNSRDTQLCHFRMRAAPLDAMDREA
ncbi:hypothetical protein K6Y74_36930, partial [Burkholderia cenocepacia]|uniref:hypothetical protein n=1 Tax=Burkholderia cenocepacia TaxID=95486 RepID=UPI0022320B3C